MCDLRPLQGGRSKILELLGGHQLSFNKTVFIVLHGVGNPDEGANKLAVEAVLRDELPPLMASESWTVDEFYWNSKVPFPLKDGRLDGRQISNIAAGWAKASRLRKKQSGRPIFPGLYQLADAGLGMLEAASGLYWFMLPILLLVDVLDESAFNFTRTITEAALIIAGSCLTTIAFAGLASGQNPRELLRSLLFIIGLPPLLLLAWAICWFRQPFVLRDDVDAGEFPYFMVSSILFLVWVLLHVVTVISLMWGTTDLENLPIFRNVTNFLIYLLSSGILLFVLFGQKWAASVFKIVADVARYLGDDDYRAELQRGLDNLIKSYDQSIRIVLLSHSLGSVIALDSLLSGRGWAPTRNVVLVTAGSPLRRLIWRFFPGALPGDTPTECVSIIRSRVASFSWINCYRPWDPIGTSLGLGRGGSGADRSTLQWLRLLTAHMNYWGDKKVFKRVAAGWLAAPVHVHQPSADEPIERASYEARLPLQKMTPRILRGIFGALITVPVIFAFGYGLLRLYETSSITALVDPTLRAGITATSSIDYSRSYVASRSGGTITHDFKVSWRIAESGTVVSVGVTEFLTNYRFDAEKLLLNPACGRHRGSCHIDSVPVRYMPDNVEVFVLPDYLPKFPRIKFLVASAFQILGLLLVGSMAASMVYVIQGRYLSFLGALSSYDDDESLTKNTDLSKQ